MSSRAKPRLIDARSPNSSRVGVSSLTEVSSTPVLWIPASPSLPSVASVASLPGLPSSSFWLPALALASALLSDSAAEAEAHRDASRLAPVG